MKNIKLEIQYNGENYCGWQRQVKEITVQEVLEKCVSNLLKEEIEIIGCSRTDSKVHALKYVCNFKSKTGIPVDKLKYALNPKLPRDIVVINAEEVHADFHSRYSSKGKTYVYKVVNRDVRNVFEREGVYHYKYDLDVDLMREGAKYLLGKHDFSAFKSVGSSVKSSVRTIKAINIRKDREYLEIEVTGDGFLYNMVRIIVGTLLQIGNKKIEFSKMKKILESKDRRSAGPTAPAQGLYLKEVYF